ncbi:MAG: hypothetical protein JNM79_02675 [Burkholderiales bacterium]|nr:hypothetical protein [Burkholderiales bacterium]
MSRELFEWSQSGGGNAQLPARAPEQTAVKATDRVGDVLDQSGSFREMACTSAEMLLSILDELCFGILVVGKQRHLSYANRLGAQELRCGNVLHLERDRVEATDSSATAALQRAIDAACRGRHGCTVLAEGKMVASLPIQGERDNENPRALLILDRGAASRSLGFVFFAQAHGLTSKEQQVLTGLADGASVEEVATRLDCAVNTARTHVRNILAKTAQANLRRLTSRLGRLPALCPRVLDRQSQGA